VDASGWQYVFSERPGKQLEISIEAPDLDYYDAETQKGAVELALINLMGEEWLIRHVEKIRVVKELGKGQRAEARSIQDMKKEWR